MTGVTIPFMSTVYVTNVLTYRSVFHRTETCKFLWKKALRPSSGYRAVELEEVSKLRPCRVCYPDAPRANFFHRYCHTCESRKPCAHNGGVLVPGTRTAKRETLYHDVGDRITVTRMYVWPEEVHKYI